MMISLQEYSRGRDKNCVKKPETGVMWPQVKEYLSHQKKA
jgi:hypothetical protein